METNASPVMRLAIAFAIFIISLGVFALCLTPLVSTLVDFFK